MRSCFGSKLPQIAEQGVVVMRARIGNTIVLVIVRKMRRFRISEKCELENAHSRKAAVPYKLHNVLGYIAEILGNNKLVTGNLRELFRERKTRSFYPFAVSGGFCIAVHRTIGFKPAKMVNTHTVKKLQRMLKTVAPP